MKELSKMDFRETKNKVVEVARKDMMIKDKR